MYYSYTVWDKISPVNGMSAEYMLKTHEGYLGEVAMVIDENGTCQLFQYDNESPYTYEEALAIAKSYAIRANNTLENKIEGLGKVVGLVCARLAGVEVDISAEEEESLILSVVDGLVTDKASVVGTIKDIGNANLSVDGKKGV